MSHWHLRRCRPPQQLERQRLDLALLDGRGLLGVAGAQILERRWRHPPVRFGLALAHLLDKRIRVDCSEGFQLLPQRPDAEFGTQSIQRVAPQLLVGVRNGDQPGRQLDFGARGVDGRASLRLP